MRPPAASGLRRARNREGLTSGPKRPPRVPALAPGPCPHTGFLHTGMPMVCPRRVAAARGQAESGPSRGMATGKKRHGKNTRGMGGVTNGPSNKGPTGCLVHPRQHGQDRRERRGAMGAGAATLIGRRVKQATATERLPPLLSTEALRSPCQAPGTKGLATGLHTVTRSLIRQTLVTIIVIKFRTTGVLTVTKGICMDEWS